MWAAGPSSKDHEAPDSGGCGAQAVWTAGPLRCQAVPSLTTQTLDQYLKSNLGEQGVSLSFPSYLFRPIVLREARVCKQGIG